MTDKGWPISAPVERFRRCMVRRRVPITLLFVTGLIAEDVLQFERPHSILNLRDIWSLTGLALIAGGLLLRTWAAGVLKKNESLATAGPYALTRNPLYLGSFFMMFGFCTLIGDLDNYAAMAALILIVYLPGIRNEQSRLLERFGTSWQQYCAATPMLVPRRLWTSFRGWSPQQWLKNNEHRAVLGTTTGLLAVALWHEIMSYVLF
jgi:protein-S-isoprenylcysteine O-methyltransferase Ste14